MSSTSLNAIREITSPEFRALTADEVDIVAGGARLANINTMEHLLAQWGVRNAGGTLGVGDISFGTAQLGTPCCPDA